MNYTVSELKSITSEEAKQLLELFAEADFAELSDGTEWLIQAVESSLLAVGAFDETGRLIGFARALGDGVSDCYIQDVAVKASCRGQGIGKALVRKVIDELKARNIDWIGLIATPGKADFYRQLGFEELANFTPMQLKN